MTQTPRSVAMVDTAPGVCYFVGKTSGAVAFYT